jgi:hypothetical protein
MAKKRKPVQSVNKMKPRGADDRGVLHSFKLGGGENAKADYDSMIDDGYHAMDDEGMAKKAYNNLKGTGMNPPSPGDVQNELRKRVPEKESPIRMYKTPTKFVSPGMTPEATGSGFKMSMGSKENFSESNFSSKDQSTMSQAPSIMKDDFGGETIEMKDQGSPLNYGKTDNVKKERKMSGAENLQEGLNTRREDKRQALNDVMAVANTAANVAGAVMPSDRRLKKDIKLISVSPSGINIYNFKYKDTKHGVGEFQGVMSDDIPYNAVVSHEDGFDRVDYSKLDIEFKAL